MIFYVDMAPTPTIPQLGSYSAAVSTGRNPPVEDFRFGATSFLANKASLETDAGSLDSSTSRLPAARPAIETTQIPPGKRDSSSAGAGSLGNRKESEVSKIAEDRIRLLAIKYASDSISSEMIARLEILNSRISERSPRVSAAQISCAENSLSAVKSIQSSRLARAQRLGLKS